jgi:hypothetical protein
LALQLQPWALRPQRWLRVLPKAIHQFLLITANISKKAVIETAQMLSPQSRIGELI